MGWERGSGRLFPSDIYSPTPSLSTSSHSTSRPQNFNPTTVTEVSHQAPCARQLLLPRFTSVGCSPLHESAAANTPLCKPWATCPKATKLGARGLEQSDLPLRPVRAARVLTWPRPFRARLGNEPPRDARLTLEPRGSPRVPTSLRRPRQDRPTTAFSRRLGWAGSAP